MSGFALSAEDVAAYEAGGIIAPYAVLDEATRAAALEAVARIDASTDGRRAGLLRHRSHLVSATLSEIHSVPKHSVRCLSPTNSEARNLENIQQAYPV